MESGGNPGGVELFGPDLLQRINIFLSYSLVLVLPDTKRLGLLGPPFHKFYFHFQAFFFSPLKPRVQLTLICRIRRERQGKLERQRHVTRAESTTHQSRFGFLISSAN